MPAQNPATVPTLSDRLASAVLVTFPVQYCDGTQPSKTNPPVFTVLVPLTSFPAYAVYTGSEGTKIFHDQCPALMATASSTTPINNSDLVALTTQIAKDYYAWENNKFSHVYDGVVAWDPRGQAHLITVTHDAEGASFDAFTEVGQQATIRTKVSSLPMQWYPEELHHTDNPSCSGQQSLSSMSSPSSAPSSLTSQPSSTPSSPSSPSTCPPANFTYAFITDVLCVNGQLQIYGLVVTVENGMVTCTFGPEYLYNAGCCDCQGSTTPSTTSPSIPSSLTSHPSTIHSSGSGSCVCPCLGANSAPCFSIDITSLITPVHPPCNYGTANNQPPTQYTLFASYNPCVWAGNSYGGSYVTFIEYSCTFGWMMTINNYPTDFCSWVLFSNDFNCCSGGTFDVYDGPSSGSINVVQTFIPSNPCFQGNIGDNHCPVIWP